MSRTALALLPLIGLASTACLDTTDAPGDTDDPLLDVDGPGTVPGFWPVANVDHVVFFGDSITAGVGASVPSREYPALMVDNDDDAWPAWTNGTLASRYPSLGVSVLDVSEGGATTSDLDDQLADLDEELRGTPLQGTGLVIATIGGNDAQAALFPGADVDGILSRALDNIDRWVGGLRNGTRFTGNVEVLITNIYEPSDGTGKTSSCFFGIDYSDLLGKLDGYNEDLGAWAQAERVGIADLNGHFRGHGFVEGRGTDLWFESDCIHPNDTGHHEIRRLLFAALDRDPLDTRRPDADADTDAVE